VRPLVPEELTTGRLFLRQWRDEDVELLAEIYAQPEYLEFMSPHDLESTRAQVERFRQHWAADGVCQWAVVDRSSEVLIGRIGLFRHHDWPEAPDPVEVGWVLHRDWWGRGLATEGGRAALELWRDRLLDDGELIAITAPANRRSRAVMERLGLEYRGATFWHDSDVVWYGTTREAGQSGSSQPAEEPLEGRA
jgi:RimJ/RimL family protein N-acetyltransferase